MRNGLFSGFYKDAINAFVAFQIISWILSMAMVCIHVFYVCVYCIIRCMYVHLFFVWPVSGIEDVICDQTPLLRFK